MVSLEEVTGSHTEAVSVSEPGCLGNTWEESRGTEERVQGPPGERRLGTRRG